LIDFILLNRFTAGDKESVDPPPHFPKGPVRDNSQAAVGIHWPLGRNAHHLDRIDWRGIRIFPAMDFRRASENLQRSDQIENLGTRRGNKDNAARPRFERRLVFMERRF
jgi:hypothetical protein